MDPSEEAQHRLLQLRWEAYKRRFGIAGFVDDDGNPIPEFLLTDTHKRILMGEPLEPNPDHQNDERDTQSE
jgi:hypothetical protein